MHKSNLNYTLIQVCTNVRNCYIFGITPTLLINFRKNQGLKQERKDRFLELSNGDAGKN